MANSPLELLAQARSDLNAAGHALTDGDQHRALELIDGVAEDLRAGRQLVRFSRGCTTCACSTGQDDD